MKYQTLVKSSSKLAIISLASTILVGCGGGGSSSTPTPPVVVTPPPVVNYNVSGTVNGLDGEVVIVVNGQSVTQAADGGFEFTNIVEAGDNVTISFTSDPFGQSCAVTGASTLTNVRSNVTGVVVDCTDIPVVNAKVQNFFTGANVDGAEVTLTRQSGGAAIIESVAVNDEGVAAFEVPLSAGRLTFSTDPVGFGAQSIIVDTPDGAEIIAAELFVQAIDLSMSFSNAAGGDVMIGDDSLATLPADGFVDASGAQVVGDINLELTLIDPSQSSDLMPGDFLAQDSTSNEISQIESFGALDLTFEDAAGNPVQLAADKTATLRIPVAERVSEDAPESIPLYFFDEDSGYWVEEGSADLMILPSGERAYEGTVSHFTTWNADRRSETVQATGCAVDTDGQPLAGVRIRSEGVDYIGSSRSSSDAQGVFTIPVRISSSQRISAFRGAQSRTLVVTSGTEDFTFADAANPESCLVVGSTVLGTNSASMTLTWGENPDDLDSYFHGRPAVETETNLPFRVYYDNEEVTVNDQTIFLDVDDTNSFGPEIITVPSFPYEGVYTYGIDLFSGSGTIASSPARVEINLGGDVSIYGPPDGEETRCWAVMRFIVDGDGNVTRETINTWEDRSYCRDGAGIAGDTSTQGKTLFGSTNSANLKKEPKAADIK